MMSEKAVLEVPQSIDAERHIFDFCFAMQCTSSTKEKKAHIAAYSGDTVIEEFLKFLFDKTIVTGISKQKINKNISESVQVSHICNSFLDMIEYLKCHNTGSDIDIKTCQNYVEQVYNKAIAKPSEHSKLDALDLKIMLNKIITKLGRRQDPTKNSI